MNFDAPIIAAQSLGGIELGSDVSILLKEVHAAGRTLNLKIYDNPGIKLHSYVIDEGILTANTDESGNIISLSCQQPYRGRYDNKLWPGMTISQIKHASQKQMLTSGALVLDGELGIYFALPSPYDEYDYFHQLPDSLVLETVYVVKRNWRGY